MPVLLEDVTDDLPDDDVHQRWRHQIYATHGAIDLRHIVGGDPAALTTDELLAHVRRLGDAIHQRREALRRWENSETNLTRGTDRFDGRSLAAARTDDIEAARNLGSSLDSTARVVRHYKTNVGGRAGTAGAATRGEDEAWRDVRASMCNSSGHSRVRCLLRNVLFVD